MIWTDRKYGVGSTSGAFYGPMNTNQPVGPGLHFNSTGEHIYNL